MRSGLQDRVEGLANEEARRGRRSARMEEQRQSAIEIVGFLVGRKKSGREEKKVADQPRVRVSQRERCRCWLQRSAARTNPPYGVISQASTVSQLLGDSKRWNSEGSHACTCPPSFAMKGLLSLRARTSGRSSASRQSRPANHVAPNSRQPIRGAKMPIH